MSLFRDGLLDGRAVAVAGAPAAIISALERLGARIEQLDQAALRDDEDQVGAWARARAPLDAIVYDARAAISSGLTSALESAWTAVREVAVGALILGEATGKVVLIAPPGDAGPEGVAAAAGLENLSRTLSVEWARYGITTVTVALRADADEERLAELVCFLCSPGGEYLSGCRLDFGPLPSPR